LEKTVLKYLQKVDLVLEFLDLGKKVVLQNNLITPIKEMKALCYNKINKLAPKIENNMDLIGK
jgi:hypothetical protein